MTRSLRRRFSSSGSIKTGQDTSKAFVLTGCSKKSNISKNYTTVFKLSAEKSAFCYITKNELILDANDFSLIHKEVVTGIDQVYDVSEKCYGQIAAVCENEINVLNYTI